MLAEVMKIPDPTIEPATSIVASVSERPRFAMSMAWPVRCGEAVSPSTPAAFGVFYRRHEAAVLGYFMIWGGVGGLGTMAIQITRELGGIPIAVVSAATLVAAGPSAAISRSRRESSRVSRCSS